MDLFWTFHPTDEEDLRTFVCNKKGKKELKITKKKGISINIL